MKLRAGAPRLEEVVEVLIELFHEVIDSLRAVFDPVGAGVDPSHIGSGGELALWR